MSRRDKRYQFEGHVLYVASVAGRWVVGYDGPCGDLSVVAAEGVKPAQTREEAQKQLDAFAADRGLQEWRR